VPRRGYRVLGRHSLGLDGGRSSQSYGHSVRCESSLPESRAAFTVSQ
jgi:hypothetical protein